MRDASPARSFLLAKAVALLTAGATRVNSGDRCAFNKGNGIVLGSRASLARFLAQLVREILQCPEH